jgi:hypothetical protein
MEPNLWTQFIRFVKDSYTKRIKQAFSGSIMGLISAQHIFFAGPLADLVSGGWWVIKGIGTVILAFSTSMATCYGAYLIDCHKEKQKKRSDGKNKRKTA